MKEGSDMRKAWDHLDSSPAEAVTEMKRWNQHCSDCGSGGGGDGKGRGLRVLRRERRVEERRDSTARV